MKVSLKYKFLVVLLGVPVLALSFYFYFSYNLFREDKINYVVGALEANSVNISKLLQLQNDKLLMVKNNFDFYLENFKDEFKGPQLNFVLGIYKLNNSNQNSWEATSSYQKVNTPSIQKTLLKMAQKVTVPHKFILVNEDYASLIFYNEKKQMKYVFLLDLGKILNSASKNKYFDVAIVTEKNQLIEMFNSEDEKSQNKVKNFFNKNIDNMGLVTDKKFYSIASNKYVGHIVTSVPQEQAMMTIMNFQSGSLAYLLMVIGIAGAVSVFITHKLTLSLRALYEGTKQVAEGNYNIEIKTKSKDEVGDLIDSFVLMSNKIKELLDELREYNERLEQIVMERTFKLRKALNLQNAMVNSLNEGFFLFNRQGEVTEVYSDSTNEMFQKDVKDNNIHELLSFEEPLESFQDFCGVIFDQQIPFEDAVEMFPRSITIDDRYLELEYSKILAAGREDLIESEGESTVSEETIYQVVCVVSDKTEELKAKRELEKERDYVKTVVTLSDSTEAYESFVKNFSESMKILIEAPQLSIDEIAYYYRTIHTLKAHAMYIGLKSLGGEIHELENKLSKFKENQNSEIFQAIKQQSRDLLKELTQIVHQYVKITGVDLDVHSADRFKKLQVPRLRDYVEEVGSLQQPNTLKQRLLASIFYVDIKVLLEKYRSEVEKLASALNRGVVEYRVSGDDCLVHYGHYANCVSSMIHLVRNSLDHGFEAKDQLSVLFEIKQAEQITITYSDNGKGVDVDKVAAKIKEVDPAAQINDQTLLMAISQDFFSLSDKVTMTSGRGVGLGSVLDEVEKLGGKTVLSTKQKGFKLTMTLPGLSIEEQLLILKQDL